jgi:uncharacterized protein YqgC (DUF456 family)
MRLLGFVLAGALLGFLLGYWIADIRIEVEMKHNPLVGLLVGEAIVRDYEIKGAAIGGIVGAVLAFFTRRDREQT